MKKAIPTNERRTKGLSSISKTILPFAKELLGKKGFVEIDILTNWEQIVGEDMSQYSLPQKIDFKRGEKTNGILHLQVPSGAFALEIQHKEKTILEKINTYFGYKAVSSLKIIQNSEFILKDINTPAKPNKRLVSKDEEIYIENLSKDITNEKLRNILTNLGKDILYSNKETKE